MRCQTLRSGPMGLRRSRGTPSSPSDWGEPSCPGAPKRQRRDWRMIQRGGTPLRAASQRHTPTPGHVYALSNPAMPGLLKIGMTRRTPEERAAELSASSGLPEPFRVEYSEYSADAPTLERTVHAALARQRRSAKREFFAINVEGAREAFRQASFATAAAERAAAAAQEAEHAEAEARKECERAAAEQAAADKATRELADRERAEAEQIAANRPLRRAARVAKRLTIGLALTAGGLFALHLAFRFPDQTTRIAVGLCLAWIAFSVLYRYWQEILFGLAVTVAIILYVAFVWAPG